MQAGLAMRAGSGKTMMSAMSSLPGSKPAVPTLEVIAGLHTGVSVSLDEPAYCLGASDEVDLVLRDAGVAPRHAVLRLEKIQSPLRQLEAMYSRLKNEFLWARGCACHYRSSYLLERLESAYLLR